MKRAKHIAQKSRMAIVASTACRGLLMLIVWTLGLLNAAQAQQDPLQSMYLNDKLLINPAYAGARDRLAATLQYRHQWAGVSQAPQTAVLSVHSPLRNKRYGLGFVLSDDRLGVTRQTSFRGAYAYRIPAGSGSLALGLSAALTAHRADLSRVTLFDEDDILFSLNENRLLPNAGFGIWYDWNNKFFASASAPKLLKGAFQADGISREGRHYFASAGYLAGNGDVIRVRTTALLRAVEQAPLQGELQVSIEFLRTVWIGAGLRSNPALSTQLMVDLPQGLGIGYAYDMDLRAAGRSNPGSHELFIRFDLPEKDQPAIPSPRHGAHPVF